MALSKYQEVAKRILGFKEGDFKLDMESYTDKHSCGTSYCLVGWLAHQDNYPKKFNLIKSRFDYNRYSEDLIGDSEDLWDFLFHESWPNTLESAHKRAQYALDNDDTPPKNEWFKFT